MKSNFGSIVREGKEFFPTRTLMIATTVERSYRYWPVEDGKWKGTNISTNYILPLRITKKKLNSRSVKRSIPYFNGDIHMRWVTPEKLSGHSRTNYAYGKHRNHRDGTKSRKDYWAEDGRIYSCISYPPVEYYAIR